MNRPIPEMIEELVTPFLNEHHFELVDVEYVKEGKNWFLRVFVDKEGGIDIDECGKISEYLSKQLDEKDPIKGAYFLEVSSPGVERPLKKKHDFEKSIGKNVYITTYEPINDSKEFEGELLGISEDLLRLKQGKKEVLIPYSKIAGARISVVFS